MSLALGSQGLVVSAWSKVMLKNYSSYALGVDGTPLRVDGYYGLDEQKVQKEYERRTGQPQDGIVSDGDLRYLGLLPTLYTVHGTGQPDPFGIGYPADIARRLTDVFWWQPVGNYPASAVPMNHSADAGEAEIARLLPLNPGDFAMVDYSQGSVCGGRIRNRLRKGEFGRYHNFLGSASFGNPMRPAGSYAGTVDPGGHGIDPTLETAVERGVLNLAAKGDLYTTCPDGQVGESERAIFNMVFERFTGKDSIIEEILELITHPLREIPAIIKAIINGGMFVGRGTGPHVRYHLDECPGTSRTYYEYAIVHLRGLAEDRLRAIIARP